MGASLLAKAVYQPTIILTDVLSSRAGSLPQRFALPYSRQAVGLLSDRLKFGVAHHQPFAAFAEVDLYPCLGTCTLEIEDDAFAEDRMLDHLAEFEFGFGNLRTTKQGAGALLLTAAERTTDTVGQSDFLDQALWYFAYEA